MTTGRIPCKAHHPVPSVADSWVTSCGTPYCNTSIYRCGVCGWYRWTCGCGVNNGESRISPRQEAAIRARKETT